MKEGNYIVRIWPSGTITMGKAVLGDRVKPHHNILFYSLEDYDKEGGVTKDSIFGYIDSNQYKHRLATQIEIDLFNKRGYLRITESELITLHRDEILNELIQ